MTWPEAYLSIPFKDRGESREDGYDCWGLVKAIYQEQRGIILPDYAEIPAGANLTKLRAILAAARGLQWQAVPAGEEQPFDVVLMKALFTVDERIHSRPIHIGCVITPGTLIHIESTGVSIAEYRRNHMLRNRVTGFFRHP